MKPIRESDLLQAGLMIDPDDPSKVVRVKDDTGDAAPSESWELDRLTAYALRGLEQAKKLETEAVAVGRKSTVQLFRAGHALHILRGKLKGDGRWCGWLKSHGVPRTNAWEAIQLYVRAKTEEAVAELTPTEAKQKYGVSRPSKSATAGHAGPSGQQRRGAPGGDSRHGVPKTPNDGDDPDSDERQVGSEPEGADSPLTVLITVSDQLAYCKDELGRTTAWSDATRAQYESALDDIGGLVDELHEVVRHNAEGAITEGGDVPTADADSSISVTDAVEADTDTCTPPHRVLDALGYFCGEEEGVGDDAGIVGDGKEDDHA